MKTAPKTSAAKFPATYAALIAHHPVRPIHDDVDLHNATEVIDAMAGHNLNPDQHDYLDALSTMVSLYEEAHHPFHKKLRPLDALKFLLDENAMNASDLGRLLGNRELGSKILRRERKLSLSHIQTLARRFAVSPALFIDS